MRTIDDIKKDGRYSIRIEHVGLAVPQWVVRFCGEYIGWDVSEELALNIARQYDYARFLPNSVILKMAKDIQSRKAQGQSVV